MNLKWTVLAVGMFSLPALAHAETVYVHDPVTCTSSVPGLQMRIENIRFRISLLHPSASAEVYLTQNSLERRYMVEGSAVMLLQTLEHNEVTPSFTYQRVTCSANYWRVKAVKYCQVGGDSIRCKVALTVWIFEYTYAVSLRVTPASQKTAQE